MSLYNTTLGVANLISVELWPTYGMKQGHVICVKTAKRISRLFRYIHAIRQSRPTFFSPKRICMFWKLVSPSRMHGSYMQVV